MAGESGELAASPPATRSALAPVAVKLAGGRVKSLATPSPVSRSPARNEGLLLLELRAFDRRQLRSTETVVTTPTGERVVERSPAPEVRPAGLAARPPARLRATPPRSRSVPLSSAPLLSPANSSSLPLRNDNRTWTPTPRRPPPSAWLP
jgi:hypothetical protein